MTSAGFRLVPLLRAGPFRISISPACEPIAASHAWIEPKSSRPYSIASLVKSPGWLNWIRAGLFALSGRVESQATSFLKSPLGTAVSLMTSSISKTFAWLPFEIDENS